MTPYSGEVPGAELMVMKDGEVLFSKSYGQANLTYDIPFRLNMPTNIGSTSKQFTAFGIALLQEQGKLSLDDDIRKYIPELPEFEDTVRILHLLNHTSGYREFLNLLVMTGRNMSGSLEREKIIEIVQRQDELQNEPGAEWNYNNTGFVLLAEVIHRVSKTPFDQWMKENVFDPLGMDSTIVRMDPNQIVVNSTQGYSMGEDGNYMAANDLGGAAGAGGIYTTLQDLSNWIRNYDQPKVGTKEMINQMMTPILLKDSSSTNYGLGLFIQEYKGLKYVHHGGADVAHRSMLMYFPEINGAVITQSNNSAFDGSIANKIADLFFEEYFMEVEKAEEKSDPEKDAVAYDYNVEKFEDLTGKYELEAMPGFVMTFKKEGERIFAQASGQPEVNLKATSDSTFQIVGVPAQLTFHLNEDGSADSLTLHQNGNHIAKKIQWDPSVEELREYTGDYFSDEIETHYSIIIEDSILMLRHYQIEDKQLSPAEKDHFSSGFPISKIEFIRDENGELLGFNGSNGRTRGVFFEKQD
jgi:CubicO group peptidase (beta-lactamase class C family)